MKKHSPLSAMTRQEIADLYHVSTKTLRNRLKEANIDLPKGLVYPKDLKKIFDRLGWPEILAI